MICPTAQGIICTCRIGHSYSSQLEQPVDCHSCERPYKLAPGGGHPWRRMAEKIMFEGHDPYLVALSVVIAILGGYTGFGLAARIRGTPDASHRLLLAGAAFFLAVGIWTMHFVGMLAAPLPADAVYLVLPTIVSFLICALVVGSIAVLCQHRNGLDAACGLVGRVARARHRQHALCRHAWSRRQFCDDPRDRNGRALGCDRDCGGLWRIAGIPGATGRRAADAERDRVWRCRIGHALHRDGGHDSCPACRGRATTIWRVWWRRRRSCHWSLRCSAS